MVETEPGAVPVEVVLGSVLAFRRRTGFCWLWLPGAHLGRPLPVVVGSAGELDAEVAGWVAQAYELAG